MLALGTEWTIYLSSGSLDTKLMQCTISCGGRQRAESVATEKETKPISKGGGKEYKIQGVYRGEGKCVE